ncbi:MAG: phosphomannomutase/phosphoglucomutase [Propionibacterium sp.]|nr:phosphomannomutase/phosphoglucomutase [Propionibacterium sp.]
MLSDAIFNANDIRGVITGDDPQWDLEGARALGAAFARITGCDEFVLGHDMRLYGEELADAFAEGARMEGADVVRLGLTSTDQLWFASGFTHLPGVQITASHNPSRYNGIKFCLEDAKPVPTDFMTRLRDLAPTIDLDREPVGGIRHLDTLQPYADKLNELVPVAGQRRLRVVVDAGNGMAGHTVDAVLGRRDLEIIGLFLELDGTFPNHPANPLEPENLVDAQRAVREHDADLALVFDGDADRCFIIDEQGEVVDPSVVTAMIATAELAREPGATIVVNTITSHCVDEAVGDRGRVVRSRVGHTYVKTVMAEENAVFGGEHSAHYYFRDFLYADTGMLAALHVLEQVRAGGPLSALASRFDGHHRSGELNFTVDDAERAQDAVARAFAGRGTEERVDGLMVRGDDWWLSLRASNTEPLLRLNVEARDASTMARVRDEVRALLTEG